DDRAGSVHRPAGRLWPPVDRHDPFQPDHLATGRTAPLILPGSLAAVTLPDHWRRRPAGSLAAATCRDHWRRYRSPDHWLRCPAGSLAPATLPDRWRRRRAR